jgi:hypothetical protein
MSQKITSKNLQYTAQLPPFLARLRGQHASETDPNAPDPILAARRRPGRPRSGSAEAEDAPLVVDEHGNAVDVTVGVDGIVKEKDPASAGAETQAQAEAAQESTDAAQREKLAGIGDQRKKRKIGKIVGAGSDEEDAKADDKSRKNEKAKTSNGTSAPEDKEKDNSAAAAKAKAKKKAKKVKLSFDEDEG